METKKQKNQLLIKFRLCNLIEFNSVSKIVSKIYEKTGRKASINFEGSKGYLACISFVCEHQASKNNQIILSEAKLFNVINVFFNPVDGLSVEISKEREEDIFIY